MGLFKLLFGSNQSNHKRKDNLNQPKNYSELEERSQELKAEIKSGK